MQSSDPLCLRLDSVSILRDTFKFEWKNVLNGGGVCAQRAGEVTLQNHFIILKITLGALKECVMKEA
jgi:hypothetical protein